MLDYGRITLDAAKTKLKARRASAVECALLIASIAALLVIVVFSSGARLRIQLRRPALGNLHARAATPSNRASANSSS